MKTIILTSMILLAVIIKTTGQTNSSLRLKEFSNGEFAVSEYNSIPQSDSSDEIKLNYGFEINRFISNSGFKPGIEFSFFVKGSEGRRSLEIAGFFDTESKNIGGISLNHKCLLFKKRPGKNSNFAPYLFYSLIYRSTTVNGPLTTDPDVARQLGNGKSSISSLEHHFGLGVKMNLRNSIYFHGDLGYGCYLGSIKKPTKPDKDTGIYEGGNGWGLFSRFGIGVEF